MKYPVSTQEPASFLHPLVLFRTQVLQPHNRVLADLIPEASLSVSAASRVLFLSFTESSVFTLYAHGMGVVSVCPQMLFCVQGRMYRI